MSVAKEKNQYSFGFLLSGRISKKPISVASASNPSEVSYGLSFCSAFLEPQAHGRVELGARGV